MNSRFIPRNNYKIKIISRLIPRNNYKIKIISRFIPRNNYKIKIMYRGLKFDQLISVFKANVGQSLPNDNINI